MSPHSNQLLGRQPGNERSFVSYLQGIASVLWINNNQTGLQVYLAGRKVLASDRIGAQRNRRRGIVAELKGQIADLRTWREDSRKVIPHLAKTYCRSLTDHLNQEVTAKVADKRLGIELQAIHDTMWEDCERTWITFPHGGDKVRWTAAGRMSSDALTKSMKPSLLLEALKECSYKVI